MDRRITNRQIIDEKHKEAGIGQLNVPEVKRRIEEGHPDPTEHIESRAGKTKGEIEALCAYGIEDVWNRSLKEISQHPPGLAKSGTGDQFLSDEEIMAEIQHYDSEDIPDFLLKRSKGLLIRSVKQWHQERSENLQSGNESKNFYQVAFNRHTKVLEGQSGRTPEEQVTAGAVTGCNTVWGMYKVLPKVYENQFGRKMPPSEFEALVKNSSPMMYALMKSQIDMFLGIKREYAGALYATDTPADSDFIPENFQLVESQPGRWELEIKPGVLLNAKPVTEDKTEAGYCPVMFAKGPSGRNVYEEIDDWMMRLAKKYYLPALEREQGNA